MVGKLKKIANLVSNMGLRYVVFRVFYMLKTKAGWQKKVFPTNPELKEYITLENWRKNLPPFFFYGKQIKGLTKDPLPELKLNFEDIKKGKHTFFSKTKLNIGTDYDWVTHPITNFKYDITKHWSEINELSSASGDIKYVWEKARFSFLYDIIRYDYHFDDDQSKFVFDEILDFIDKNPINKGPNYKCSQEISLRVLNWTFALYYYKDSNALTSQVFKKIIHAVYWQLHHVYKNIHFSRISVRNNHAITETLMLYLSAKLYPFLPNVNVWSKKGKHWFEQEIAYQIYADGTFLQFSMNYHRVAVQLLTWGIQLAKLNKDTFKDVVYDRAKKSLQFLDASTDQVSGKLPNYGANDGALFFNLTTDDYRVYTSQLNDLRAVLEHTIYNNTNSVYWYGLQPTLKKQPNQKPIHNFKLGGYYIMQDANTKTFIKCGAYKDRPVQSDNLHVDVWVNGINYLRDNGSYKYNTNKEMLNYFNGCQGHNTISVSKENQMLKGGRFIWYNWVKLAKATLTKKENIFVFNGNIKAFKNLGNSIYHNRKVVKKEGEFIWEVTDNLSNVNGKTLYQYWHVNPKVLNKITITAKDAKGIVLHPKQEKKWYSSYYGVKETSIMITFATNTCHMIQTTIKIND